MWNRALVLAFVCSLILSSGAWAAQFDPSGRSPTRRVPAKASTLEAADVISALLDSVSESSERSEMGGANLIWPVRNSINTPFGNGHDGIDIEGETGDPIVAAGSGRITFTGDDGDGYGTKIVIAHGEGIRTLYSHLADIRVDKGWVSQGDLIGTVGCTGSCTGDHLHFEIQRNEQPTNPVPMLPSGR